MDGITSRDLPWVIGFIVVALLGFWLVGRLAERGLFRGSGSLWLAAFCFAALATFNAVNQGWLGATLYGVGALGFVANAIIRRRRSGTD